jgi:N-acetylglucosaminyl-diphospho-decaprenol L-rhamnosyltransferase
MWNDWVTLLPLSENGGFAAGNNAGIHAALREVNDSQAFWLLNSDTYVRRGALLELCKALDQHPQAGIVSPRLEWPDGTPQVSCFRRFRPSTELVKAAATSTITKIFRRGNVALPLSDQPFTTDWTSFASVLIRRAALMKVGDLDTGYFMYYEDADYCRRMWRWGLEVLHIPRARVVHLRGGTSPVKSLGAQRKRRPRYFYAARTRHYAKWYGGWVGVLLANICWHLGRMISFSRELIRNKKPHTCDNEWRDIWTNFSHPLTGVNR